MLAKRTVKPGALVALILLTATSSAFSAGIEKRGIESICRFTNGNLSQAPLLHTGVSFVQMHKLVVGFDKTYGGLQDDYSYSIISTSDQGFLLVGGTNSYGAGGTDFWIVKTDAYGRKQWEKAYGGSGYDEAHSAARTADGGYVILGTTDSFGHGSYDMWLLKISPTGTALWNKTYGGIGIEDGWSIIRLLDGTLVMAGWTSSYGAGSGDFWLVKINQNGNAFWNRTFGGAQLDVASSIRQASGGFILAGYTYSYGVGGSDFFIVKTDSNGQLLWNKTIGGAYDEYAFSIAATTDGGFAALGSTSSFGAGVYDVWLVKMGYTGNVLWNKTYGSVGYEEGWTVFETPGNGFALTGWTDSFGSGLSDCWLILTDSQGMVIQQKVWGGTNDDYAYAATSTKRGRYVIAGKTDSFGQGNFDSLILEIIDPFALPKGGGGHGALMT